MSALLGSASCRKVLIQLGIAAVAAAVSTCPAQQLPAKAKLQDELANLSGREPAARSSAAQELSQMGSGAVDAVPSLAVACGDRFPRVRVQAVKALGEILKGSEDSKVISVAVNALVSRYNDSSEDVRAAARASIERIGPNATASLISGLGSAVDIGAKRFVVDILYDSQQLTPAFASEIASVFGTLDLDLQRKCAEIVVRTVNQCAVRPDFCTNELPGILKLRSLLSQNTDPVLRQHGASLKVAMNYLDSLRVAAKKTKIQDYLEGHVLFSWIIGLIELISVLALAVTVVRQRGRIRHLNTHVESISQAKAMQQQNDSARAILKRFVTMPEREERPGFTIASAFRDSSEVSGDFYNWFSRIDGSVCIYLVDVEGNGINAAIQATHAAKVLERTLTRGDIETAPKLLENADRVMYEDLRQPNIAVTMDLVEIYPDKIELANAGMPAPLFFRHGQAQPQQLQAAGAYVGAGYSRFPVEPRSAKMSVNDGDLLILYSDGVLEARGKNGIIFGRDGIESAVTRDRDHVPDVIANGILKAAAEHTGSELPEDDQTVIVVRFGSHKPLGVGAQTLVVVSSEESEAEFTLINAADSAEVCDSVLQLRVKEWLKPFNYSRTPHVWCAVWEGIMNAVAYGSYRGDLISLKMRHAKEGIVVEVEQPKEWRDWDKFLGSTRKAKLPNGSEAPRTAEDLGGTATLLKLADSVTASRQGRLLTLLFKGVERGGGRQ